MAASSRRAPLYLQRSSWVLRSQQPAARRALCVPAWCCCGGDAGRRCIVTRWWPRTCRPRGSPADDARCTALGYEAPPVMIMLISEEGTALMPVESESAISTAQQQALLFNSTRALCRGRAGLDGGRAIGCWKAWQPVPQTAKVIWTTSRACAFDFDVLGGHRRDRIDVRG